MLHVRPPTSEFRRPMLAMLSLCLATFVKTVKKNCELQPEWLPTQFAVT